MSLLKGKAKGFNIKKHKTIVILISLAIALMLTMILNNINKSATKEKTVPILVAKDKIQKESSIKESMYEIIYEKPRNGQDYISADELKNYITTSEILEGESITKERLKDTNSKSENKKILYSLKLDPSDCVAGTLRAGNKVNVISATASNGTGISEYLFESAPNVPKDIKVNSVYDANSTQITDGSSPASTILLELDDEQAPILRVAELSKNVKLVLARNR